MGFEPMTLWTKGDESTNGPPRPTCTSSFHLPVFDFVEKSVSVCVCLRVSLPACLSSCLPACLSRTEEEEERSFP